MRIGRGSHTYEWVDGWAKIPDTESARTGWAHHGIVVSENGGVISFHQADPKVLVFDMDGNLERSWDADVENAHGMHIVKEGGDEFLWLADNTTGKVVKATLEGETVLSLERPNLAVYKEGKYAPTGVSVNQTQHGGNGDVWVADGYGESYVHRYDRDGVYMGSINGEEGDAGAFDCPHGIWVDTRREEAELYVADRANGRIQVYDLDGGFKRTFGRGPGKDYLHSPSGFATIGDHLIVAELRGSRVTVLDLDDNPVAYLGENTGAFLMIEDWPNVSKEHVESGLFNSPHGLAADVDGNLYVAEWMVGGRISKLEKA